MRESTKLRTDVEGKSWPTLLREFRRELGLSRRGAAKAWGLSWRTIEGWELGRSEPTGLYRERLEQVFKSR
jgi:DNA-binding transcriptional regulator YiaG